MCACVCEYLFPHSGIKTDQKAHTHLKIIEETLPKMICSILLTFQQITTKSTVIYYLVIVFWFCFMLGPIYEYY